MDILAALNQPFAVKSLKVKNRFAMSPMTRYRAAGGKPTTAVAQYYWRRAEGGVGLVISEGVGLDRVHSRSVSLVPEFHGDALAGWQAVLDDVHAAGAAMMPQAWHVGGVPDGLHPEAAIGLLESPSGLIGPDVAGGRPMSEQDIAEVIGSYARAAADAKRLGFDAIEVHAAHGYLVDQFFWRATNRREDRYGGTGIKQRSRFGVDLIRAMRQAVGDRFALVMRISQWKIGHYSEKLAETPDALEDWLGPLADAGVDMFDCSQRRFWEPEFADSDLNLAGWVKAIVGKPTITVGSVGLDRDLFADFESGASKPDLSSLLELVRRFERGDFDMVAVGRALLADPCWLSKVRAGRFSDLKPYSAEAMETLF